MTSYLSPGERAMYLAGGNCIVVQISTYRMALYVEHMTVHIESGGIDCQIEPCTPDQPLYRTGDRTVLSIHRIYGLTTPLQASHFLLLKNQNSAPRVQSRISFAHQHTRFVSSFEWRIFKLTFYCLKITKYKKVSNKNKKVEIVNNRNSHILCQILFLPVFSTNV